MKIVICASMSAAGKMAGVRDHLERRGHQVVLPANYQAHAARTFSTVESTEEKIGKDLIRDYYRKIGTSDAILVLNYDKNGVANYIGGNTFLEMGFAHVLGKPIFLLNPIPDVSYRQEIEALQPVILHGDLDGV